MIAQDKFNRYNTTTRECDIVVHHRDTDHIDGTLQLVMRDLENDEKNAPRSMRFLRMTMTFDEASKLHSQLGFALSRYLDFLVSARKHTSVAPTETE